MKRRDLLGVAAAPLLLGSVALAQAQGAPVEGVHFKTLRQSQPAASGAVEVTEFFWYGCPVCDGFEPYLVNWAQKLDAGVVLRKVHVGGRAQIRQHQQLFLTLEAMGEESRLRPRIFDALHRQHLALDSEEAIAQFVVSQGVDGAKFKSMWQSFGLQARMQQANQLVQRTLSDSGVPTLCVGGRYITSPAMAGVGAASRQEAGRRALVVTDYLLEQLRRRA
ncbi:thiol:disulfide interchange protein DsbA/DsbL [Roseateles sp. BYS180W]|uniref:Thiol:disulfide interchange protein n=1 Tax=Roseateles rivi TaxID=3299028 RepID=A0ABW7FTV4_9BURK